MSDPLADNFKALASSPRIYKVSELNREVRELLECHFLLVWLEGEVSNLARPASGHVYFSLKDQQAQIRCALFRNRARLSQTPLSNGQHIRVRARISLYEPRGDYQLIIEHWETAGEGALRQAFDALRTRLEQEGLFALERKRKPPSLPERIGLITSPNGAALHDVLSVLKRRFPALPVLLYPAQVQGEGAAERIVQALELASRRQDCDVLLLVRGGGSLEDLWTFNEEVVARAIAACTIPVISGVGHESDVTIADFVADVRAATPSAAAELISPDRAVLLARLQQLERRLQALTQAGLQQQRSLLAQLGQRLERQRPEHRLQQQAQRLDELEQRLQRAITARLRGLQQQHSGLHARLIGHAPRQRLLHARQHRQTLAQRLHQAMQGILVAQRQNLSSQAQALHNLSPLQTLQRGYAIVRTADGRVLRRAVQAQPGDRVEALLGEGRLFCKVEESGE